MAPAGAVGLAGDVGGADVGLVAVVGADGVGPDLGVGKEGSVGPAPGVAIGLPSMTKLQPETKSRVASEATSSSEPPARLRCAFRDKRTRYSPKFWDIRESEYARSNECCCNRAAIDIEPMAQGYRCVTESHIASAARCAKAHRAALRPAHPRSRNHRDGAKIRVVRIQICCSTSEIGRGSALGSRLDVDAP